MRSITVLALIAASLPAAAYAAGDRYGDRSPAQASAQIAQTYHGPTLSWSNKVAPAAPAVSDAPPNEHPRTQALAGRSRASALPPAPEMRGVERERTYRPFQPQTPIPLQWSAPKANLPGTLYDAPVAAAAAPQPTPPARIASTPPQQLATAPTQYAAAAPELLGGPIAGPPPQRGVGGATRLYSVHRGYGMAPDAIPESRGGYVLIGPPDAGVADAPDAEDDDRSARDEAF